MAANGRNMQELEQQDTALILLTVIIKRAIGLYSKKWYTYSYVTLIVSNSAC
jgi:hypothetical protein